MAGRHYPHKWRHTFATELVRSGVDLRIVQLLMGHVSIHSTTLYTHMDDSDLRTALDGVYLDGEREPPPAMDAGSPDTTGCDHR